MRDVEAQQLAEQRALVLRVVPGVAGRAAVADADVEVAVGAEGEHAAVVVAGGVLHVEHRGARSGVGAVGVARDAVAGDRHLRTWSGVRDVEAAAGRVVGGEGEAEQAALAAARVELAAEVEEGRGEQPPVAHDANRPALLDDEEPAAAVAGVGDEERLLEAAHERLERDTVRGRAGGGRAGAPRCDDPGANGCRHLTLAAQEAGGLETVASPRCRPERDGDEREGEDESSRARAVEHGAMLRQGRRRPPQKAVITPTLARIPSRSMSSPTSAMIRRLRP